MHETLGAEAWRDGSCRKPFGAMTLPRAGRVHRQKPSMEIIRTSKKAVTVPETGIDCCQKNLAAPLTRYAQPLIFNHPVEWLTSRLTSSFRPGRPDAAGGPGSGRGWRSDGHGNRRPVRHLVGRRLEAHPRPRRGRLAQTGQARTGTSAQLRAANRSKSAAAWVAQYERFWTDQLDQHQGASGRLPKPANERNNCVITL